MPRILSWRRFHHCFPACRQWSLSHPPLPSPLHRWLPTYAAGLSCPPVQVMLRSFSLGPWPCPPVKILGQSILSRFSLLSAAGEHGREVAYAPHSSVTWALLHQLTSSTSWGQSPDVAPARPWQNGPISMPSFHVVDDLKAEGNVLPRRIAGSAGRTARAPRLCRTSWWYRGRAPVDLAGRRSARELAVVRYAHGSPPHGPCAPDVHADPLTPQLFGCDVGVVAPTEGVENHRSAPGLELALMIRSSRANGFWVG